MKQFDRRQAGDGWVGVSTMSNTDTVIEDRNKTAFDWCKDGDTKHLLHYLKTTKTNVNKQDENVRKYHVVYNSKRTISCRRNMARAILITR